MKMFMKSTRYLAPALATFALCFGRRIKIKNMVGSLEVKPTGMVGALRAWPILWQYSAGESPSQGRVKPIDLIINKA